MSVQRHVARLRYRDRILPLATAQLRPADAETLGRAPALPGGGGAALPARARLLDDSWVDCAGRFGLDGSAGGAAAHASGPGYRDPDGAVLLGIGGADGHRFGR